MDIEAAAKKHAADLMDKLTEKRCAHMSDLVDAFKRALTDAQPKNVWGVTLGMFPPAPAEIDDAAWGEICGRFVKAGRVTEDDGA